MTHSQKPKIYLAGQISGLSYDGTVEWRDEAAFELGTNFLCLSPMRAKDFLEKTGVEIEEGMFTNPIENALTSPKGIVARDHNDVMTCDAVLMYLLNPTKVSIGTMIEIGWAHAYRKPIILVMDRGNIHDHSMVTEIASFIVPDLESGIKIIQALFPIETGFLD